MKKGRQARIKIPEYAPSWNKDKEEVRLENLTSTKNVLPTLTKPLGNRKDNQNDHLMV